MSYQSRDRLPFGVQGNGCERHSGNDMTSILIARCPLTGAFGIGIATYSLAVGSKCPAIATGCGTITTQAFVNPTFKAFGMRLLDNGHPAQQTLELLQASDADIGYRQIGIIDR
jgi:uncharacterized Ntn-hydrolase superfamily protein